MCLLLYKTGLSVSVDPQSIIGPKTWELNILMKDGLVASQRVSGPENIQRGWNIEDWFIHQTNKQTAILRLQF